MRKLFRFVQQTQNLGISLGGIILAVLLVGVIQIKTESVLRENNNRYLSSLTKTTALQFDSRDLQSVIRERDFSSPIYQRIQTELRSIMQQNPDIFAMAILVETESPNRFEYIANVHLFDRDLNSDGMITADEEPIASGHQVEFLPDSAIYQSLWSPAIEEQVLPDSLGITRSVYSTIVDEQHKAFAILKIDVAQKAFLHDLQTSRWFLVGILLGLLVLVVLLSYILAKGEHLRKHLQQVNQIKDDFISITSHELRTPMTVIQSYIDFLINDKYGTVSKEQRNILKKVLGNTDQLLSLINNLLDINQLELGKMQFRRETF